MLESESNSYPLNVMVQGNMQNSAFQTPSPSREKGNPKLRKTIIIHAKENRKYPVDMAEEVCKKFMRLLSLGQPKELEHECMLGHTFLKNEEDSRPSAIIACEELARRRKQ